MHLNWDTCSSALLLILVAIGSGRDLVQATRAGHPRRRLHAVLWMAGWLVVTVAHFLPGGMPRNLISVIGLGIMAYSLWVLYTLPPGERPKEPAAKAEQGAA